MAHGRYSAHLVDCVLPEVPVRQWVLTLPYPLRYRCAWDTRLTSEVLRAFLRALFADQRRRARIHYVEAGLCGAVTAIQRVGSVLNTNPHFHSIVPDGVYNGPPHAPGPFLPLPPPRFEDVTRVMAGTARRVIRLLEKRGLENEHDPLATDDPLLATLIVASVRSRIATGPEVTRKLRLLPLERPYASRSPEAALSRLEASRRAQVIRSEAWPSRCVCHRVLADVLASYEMVAEAREHGC